MSDMTPEQYAALLGRAAALTTTRQATHAHSEVIPRTPIEYGTLRQSLQVTPGTPADPTSSLATSLDYAIYVHEDLTARHPEGEAKFMEKGVAAAAVDNEAIGAQAMREVFGA